MNDVWRIDRGPDFATLHSTLRMPHSPARGPMDAARRALRSALKDLAPAPGKILEGIYSSKIDGFFDVENVVLYNVETAAFRSAGRNGVRARRDRATHDPSFAHCLDYRFVHRPASPCNAVVHLEFVPASFRSVFDVWWAASNGAAAQEGEISGRYGLHVELIGRPVPSNPAGKMKILFDGIIAAVQLAQVPQPEIIDRLSLKYGVDADTLHLRFAQPIAAAITPSRRVELLRPFGAGVQWHPADDLCEECTLIVSEGPTPRCNAYVYPL